MPESLLQVQQHLANCFSPKFQISAHFPTYVSMGSFLSDPSQYCHALLKLEMLLEDARGARVDAIKFALERQHRIKIETRPLLELLQGIREGRHINTPIPKDILVFVPFAKQLFSKLLSSVLFEWESQNGFTLDPKGKVDILFGNPGRLFNDELKAGRPFKDVGAGAEHGEFTHRIQWFMVGTGLQLPNTGDIYKDIAKWMTPAEQRSLDGRSQAKRFLWEFLFDRDGMPSNASSVAFQSVDKYDFRAPSNLNRFFMEPKSGCPILAWCLQDRFNKRKIQNLTMEYIEKKAPANPEAQRAGQVARAIGSGTFNPETDMPVLDRVQKGLFIRRGEVIVDIAWQG
jgi:hypothetical protein